MRPNQNTSTRLGEWYQLVKTPYFYEEPTVSAGRQAEAWLQSLIEKHINYKGAQLFAGKRVSSSKRRGKREIDLIIVTPTKLYIIEVKNWSGQLFVHGGDWVHIKRDGRQKPYHNLVEYNNEKRTILLEYLSEQGIKLASEQISQKVIFPNRKLQVDNLIHDNPEVITADKLMVFLNQQKRNNISTKMVCSII
ncbi:MAG: nuclease-related domain-containing protein, partial [Acidobacteriota bacterium]